MAREGTGVRTSRHEEQRVLGPLTGEPAVVKSVLPMAPSCVWSPGTERHKVFPPPSSPAALPRPRPRLARLPWPRLC